jgi:YgiT-type zinc finger domain-containing protein
MATGYTWDAVAERRVTYTIEVNGQLFVIENVPSRVCVETGEPYFSSTTMEGIQRIIAQRKQHARFDEECDFVAWRHFR